MTAEWVTDRRAIVTRILTLLDPNSCSDDIDNAMRTWWWNVRKSGGLRLTPMGVSYFDRAEIEYWDVPLEIEEIRQFTKLILELDRKMLAPFALLTSIQKNHTRPIVRLYDGRIVVLITLYGSLTEYLNNCETRSSYERSKKA